MTVNDGENGLSIFAAMPRDAQWTLATLSSRAGKAVKPPLPRPALDGNIIALRRRKQVFSPRGRRGVGVRGDGHRASPNRAARTIGVIEATTAATTDPAPHPMIVPRHSPFGRFELSDSINDHSGDAPARIPATQVSSTSTPIGLSATMSAR